MKRNYFVGLSVSRYLICCTTPYILETVEIMTGMDIFFVVYFHVFSESPLYYKTFLTNVTLELFIFLICNFDVVFEIREFVKSIWTNITFD